MTVSLEYYADQNYNICMYEYSKRAFGTRQNANKNTAVNLQFNLLDYIRIRVSTKMFNTLAAVIVSADCSKIEQKKDS